MTDNENFNEEYIIKNGFSPLYTNKAMAEKKKQLIKTLGKDKDGAYRVRNRIDKEG